MSPNEQFVPILCSVALENDFISVIMKLLVDIVNGG